MKTAVLVVVVTMAVAGVAYGTLILNSNTAQSPPPVNNCGIEQIIGNFTSDPQMSDSGAGPYNVTFYVRNQASQSTTITEFTDQNGLTQPVNWTIPGSTTGSFQATIYKSENSLVLETACGTFVNTSAYSPISTTVHHYEITLFVSVGNTAK